MWYVYILYSKTKNKYYVGYTNNPVKRLIQHNSGGSKSTKAHIPWTLKYQEVFATKGEAIRRERQIKSKKSRNYIECLLRDKEEKI